MINGIHSGSHRATSERVHFVGAGSDLGHSNSGAPKVLRDFIALLSRNILRHDVLLLPVDAFGLHEVLLVGAATDAELLLLGEDGAVVLDAVLVELAGGRLQLGRLPPLRLLLDRLVLVEVVYQLVSHLLILHLAWIVEGVAVRRPG